jgi:[ribosomal protein S5]-alanine N-acetyltransferase
MSRNSGVRNVTFRSWLKSDLESLVENANNRNVWINMKDLFPHPFTAERGEDWLRGRIAPVAVETEFAVDVDGLAVGGISLELCEDVYRHTGLVHYWLGEKFWGLGIATRALRFIIDYAWTVLSLTRLQAAVFEWNAASARVLQKAGFAEEGRLMRAVNKDGRMGDLLLFGCLRETPDLLASRSGLQLFDQTTKDA